MPREAFPGYDEPVNTDLEPEDAIKAILGVEIDGDPGEQDEATED